MIETVILNLKALQVKGNFAFSFLSWVVGWDSGSFLTSRVLGELDCNLLRRVHLHALDLI
jgi:hypothetical protein